MIKVLYIGLGGFIGAILRYLVSVEAAKYIDSKLPAGTLIVNILGGLLIGFIMQLTKDSNVISDELKLFLTTGLMGGLTTFSTFSYETVNLFSREHYLLAGINILLNVLLSILGVVIGIKICK
ncbi:fluoride efflux transporter CrcB [Romboutsia weinsteinii]|uniref:Fluoride-specific ion channel FluC n=1 Tax=Romboutsia weinsteinii TaxID=2020949 RepID=A0A371J962_9FIRM|nr:fluoride efflux transporter CrcB [Romboutsia weinsteinii]RDY29216.1 fluoride efflux transporter CrcB [Romboutsia weinsteinii]